MVGSLIEALWEEKLDLSKLYRKVLSRYRTCYYFYTFASSKLIAQPLHLSLSLSPGDIRPEDLEDDAIFVQPQADSQPISDSQDDVVSVELGTSPTEKSPIIPEATTGGEDKQEINA